MNLLQCEATLLMQEVAEGDSLETLCLESLRRRMVMSQYSKTRIRDWKSVYLATKEPKQ